MTNIASFLAKAASSASTNYKRSPAIATMLQKQIDAIKENNYAQRIKRHLLRTKLEGKDVNPALAEKIKRDIELQTPIANPVFTQDSPYKQMGNNTRGAYPRISLDAKPRSSYYDLKTKTITLKPSDSQALGTIAHEYGHAMDPRVKETIKNYKKVNRDSKDPYTAAHDTMQIELRAGENGRRMLRDGYGVPEQIATSAYKGVPTYSSYIGNAMRLNDKGKLKNIFARKYTPMLYGDPHAPMKHYNPLIKQWSPENRKAIKQWEHDRGLTPESVAQRFTAGIVDNDPIRRRLAVRDAIDRSNRVNMEAFESDESAYNSFMPKLPSANSSGLPVRSNNNEINTTKWQPVRTQNVYADNPQRDYNNALAKYSPKQKSL